MPGNLINIDCPNEPFNEEKELLLSSLLEGACELNDRDVEDIERFTGIMSIDIISYLLRRGWKVKPAVLGLRYSRF